MANPKCLCGCGKATKGGTFLPGHDAKLRGKIVRKDIKPSAAQMSFFRGHGWKIPK